MREFGLSMSLGMSREIVLYNDYIVRALGFFVPEP